MKSICKECGGSMICSHGKHKHYCKPCGGSACCKSPWCDTIPSNPRYEGYCLVCYIHQYPEQPITRNYKTKESAVASLLKDAFPEQTWVHDRRVQDGCSFRRPDLLCDMGSHVVIVEIDEDQHSGYESLCENRRIMEISRDVGHRPIVLIRFNPDSYTDSSGNQIPGCWRLNGFGTCSIVNDADWTSRTEKLVSVIKQYLERPADRTVTVIQLFFSQNTTTC
jgi:hypothetical protein